MEKGLYGRLGKHTQTLQRCFRGCPQNPVTYQIITWLFLRDLWYCYTTARVNFKLWMRRGATSSLRNQGRWKIFLLAKRLSLNTPKELPFKRATSGTRHWFLNQKFLPQVNGDGKNSIKSGLSYGQNCRRLRNHVWNFYVASARKLAEETVNVTKEIWSARLSMPVMDSAIKTKLWATEHCAHRLTSQYMLKISCFMVICYYWYRINGQQHEILDGRCQQSRNSRC